MNRLLQNTAIVGIGQTEFSKNSGRPEMQLAAEASLAAIRDAGLTPADIDGMMTFGGDHNDEQTLQRCLGIPVLRWTGRTPPIWGGASASAIIQHAAAAVTAGAAKSVLIYRAMNGRSERQHLPEGAFDGGPDFHYKYGLDTPAKVYALQFQIYMNRFGVTNADLGLYSVVARKHAATNPRAWFYGKPITLEDHQNSRWIVEPIFRLLDCCLESDGGVALIVTSMDRAKDLKQPPVRVIAASQLHLRDGFILHDFYRNHLEEYEDARVLGYELWNETGLTPKDMDVAMIYENFSPVVFMQLEAFGFCRSGEAKDFIKDGSIEIGGQIPVNTHGGLLGEAYIHGVNNILEAVRQLRGTAANQVKDAEHVMITSGRSAAILGKA